MPTAPFSSLYLCFVIINIPINIVPWSCYIKSLKENANYYLPACCSVQFGPVGEAVLQFWSSQPTQLTPSLLTVTPKCSYKSLPLHLPPSNNAVGLGPAVQEKKDGSALQWTRSRWRCSSKASSLLVTFKSDDCPLLSSEMWLLAAT